MKTCSVIGCGRIHSAKGYCQKHYDIARKDSRPYKKRDRRAYMRRRRQERWEAIQAYNKRYKQTEFGKIANRTAAHNQNRKRALVGRLDSKTVQQVYEENIKKYGTLTCELCFKPVTFGQDAIEHDVPISRKDEFPNVRINSRENLSVAHGVGSTKNCNSLKGKMTKKEWFSRHPEYRMK